MKIFILAAGIGSRPGEAVDIYFTADKDIIQFIEGLEEYKDNNYFGRHLKIAIEKDGLRIPNIDILQYDGVGIVFKEDLVHANNLFL